MPKICVEKFPILAEMTYLKMVSVLILDAFNKSKVSSRFGEIAKGPLTCELLSLEQSRQSTESSPDHKRIHDLVVAFNSHNKYSMVCYPVGMHYDHFPQKKESLENKILLCCPRQGHSIGRGGSLAGNEHPQTKKNDRPN